MWPRSLMSSRICASVDAVRVVAKCEGDGSLDREVGASCVLQEYWRLGLPLCSDFVVDQIGQLASGRAFEVDSGRVTESRADASLIERDADSS